MRKLILGAAFCFFGSAASAADLGYGYGYGSRPPPPEYDGPAGAGSGYALPVPRPGYDRPLPATRPGDGGPAGPTYGEVGPDDDDDGDGWDEAVRPALPALGPDCWTRPTPWGPERLCRR